ncbi:uncharacterized protein CTHT_0015560 [Thermochaetoides thermophila DSM 1495]|uniref:DUF7136 domain-containing protein n=1 Tax=Chaetomium thermophilum (strain DSM 1495 / CBS 144.50 / IMI 039719) TaxID=759272 RepID=G0S210_CHATD|nr:hypothetical protein CTHT_0015560 [Thermochaetoides thermophila DSM 1495]EGS23070.1 hypothetical protein CTHT_0015560 [Thermochaetoides thermophila DSM 1495]
MRLSRDSFESISPSGLALLFAAIAPHALPGVSATSATAVTTSSIEAQPIPLEIDLVFPRNDTYYLPTPALNSSSTDGWLPILFAIHNPTLARFVYPAISYTITPLDGGDPTTTEPTIIWTHDLRLTRFDLDASTNSSDSSPYLLYRHFSGDVFYTSSSADEDDEDKRLLRRKRRFLLTWLVSYQSCSENVTADLVQVAVNRFRTRRGNVTFTLSPFETDGRSINLTTLTEPNQTNKATCNAENHSVVIGVDTSQTWPVGPGVKWGFGICAATAAISSPSYQPDPCGVRVKETDIDSMDARLKKRLCSGMKNPPEGCPVTNAAGRITAQLWAAFLAVVGFLVL